VVDVIVGVKVLIGAFLTDFSVDAKVEAFAGHVASPRSEVASGPHVVFTTVDSFTPEAVCGLTVTD